MESKLRVAVLGGTGAVGQRFISLLSQHPWFELHKIMASERSAGKPFKQACTWHLEEPIKETHAHLPVEPCIPTEELDLAFSGLDASIAGPIEEQFARSGIPVVSNTRIHRMMSDIPLIIPEINPDHLSLINIQKTRFSDKGFIVTNPNCSVIVMALALAPLHKRFRIKKVIVSTLQAVSGAGYPGISSMDILDNAIPYIPGEVEKMESEPLKIFGNYEDGVIVPAEFQVSAQCHRVMVSDGHLLAVSVLFQTKPKQEEILETWHHFNSLCQTQRLPSTPDTIIQYIPDLNRPQPRKDRNTGHGMTISVGRLSPCSVLDYKFSVLGHNTIRGAAGGSILIGEQLIQKGYIKYPISDITRPAE